MKLWVLKKDFEFLKEMQNKSRTKTVEFSTFRQFDNNSEIEVEVRT